MDSEFRLCPACRAPNTVQDAVCTACGARLPAVSKAPAPTFDAIPGRQEARAAAGTGVRRGLLVGIVSAAVLGLLVARTFRSPSLQAVSAPPTAAPILPPQPQATPEPYDAGVRPVAPILPAGVAVSNPDPYATANPYGRSNPYAMPSPDAYTSPNPYGSPYPSQVAAVTGSPSPSLEPSRAPAISIAAPDPSTRPAPGAAAKPASYTDADLERIRNQAEEPAPAAASEGRPVAASPSPRRPAPTGEEREARLRERRDAVRSAQRRADEAQTAVDDIRREARENDDDGLQEELKDALAELKSAQRDLSKAQRALRELEDPARPVLPPQ